MHDTLRCIWAVLAFAVVLLCPGYALAWIADLASFRSKALLERLVWSIVLSFCAVPIAAELIAKYASLNILTGCFLLPFLSVCAITTLEWHRHTLPARDGDRSTSIVAVGLVAWLLVAIVELIDIHSISGKQLFLNVAIYDHSLRTAFVDAVLRTGSPPVDPLYWPGHPVTMRYYYFWYILCAVVAKLAHVGARTALIASSVWSGFGLAALVALFVKYFRDEHATFRRTQVVFALSLLLVTGLDLLPFFGCLAAGDLPADTEWWSWDQISSWFDTCLWVPHHLAALVCCLTGFLLLWLSSTPRNRWLNAILAGVAFASAFGLSIWVAFGFAILMFGWLLSLRDPAMRIGLLAAGLVCVLLLIPFLQELRTPQGSTAAASGDTLLTIGARPMIPPDLLESAPGFRQLAHTHPWLEQQLAMLTLMPLGYALELGFFAVVLVLAVRGRRLLGKAGRTALGLCAGCVVLTSFLRSAVIANNDFGIRVMLIAQFFLVLLAVQLKDQWKGRLLHFMWGLAIFGAAGTVVQAVTLRTFLPIEDHLGRPEYRGLGQRAADISDAFTQLDQRIPRDAVVAYLPDESKYYNFIQTLYAERQVVNEWPSCNTSFGGDPANCPAIQSALHRLYAGAGPSEAQSICSGLAAQYLVAARWEPVWSARTSWVWTLPTVVATDSIRVVRCADVSPTPR